MKKTWQVVPSYSIFDTIKTTKTLISMYDESKVTLNNFVTWPRLVF